MCTSYVSDGCYNAESNTTSLNHLYKSTPPNLEEKCYLSLESKFQAPLIEEQGIPNVLSFYLQIHTRRTSD